MKVKNLTQTCIACPSQWEGHIEDGRMFYCRYRYGHLSIEISKSKTNNVGEAMEIRLYSEVLGDEYDGVMSEDELVGIMKDIGFKFEY